jgi:uncharacterized protein YcbX
VVGSPGYARVTDSPAARIERVPATVTWIAYTPVKGLRLRHCEETSMTVDGVPGDRAFFLVDERRAMVSATRLGPLVAVEAEHDQGAGTLTLTFPDGRTVAGSTELGDAEEVRFHDLTLSASPVIGPFSRALSEHCGVPLRMFASPRERSGIDRGRIGAVTLVSLASLERLQAVAGESSPIDPRRFRMTLGVDGLGAHEEDHWIDRAVRVGEATLGVAGNVGRCALTTRNADTGVVDFQTLHHLRSYRREEPATEPLPFGVHASVLEPGRVRVGDVVELCGGVTSS